MFVAFKMINLAEFRGNKKTILIGSFRQEIIGKFMYTAEVMVTEKMILIDNGGRRLIDDRRLYSYNGYLPERRSGEDRRSGLDRRIKSRQG